MTNISLAITAYNKDYYLIYNLLKEFCKQTAPPSEIIFYCSGMSYVKDIPENIIIADKNVPINTIFNKKRTIQSVARNICAKTASSDIIIFFDVDDIPNPFKVEITDYIFRKNNIDFLLHNYNNNDSNFIDIDRFNPILNFNLELNPHNTNLICENFPIHHAHIAVKKEIFLKIQFNEEQKYYRKEDGKFCQDLLIHKYRGCYCRYPLVNYIS